MSLAFDSIRGGSNWSSFPLPSIQFFHIQMRLRFQRNCARWTITIQKSLRSRQLVHVSLSRKRIALQSVKKTIGPDCTRCQCGDNGRNSSGHPNASGTTMVNGYWVRMFENISASFRHGWWWRWILPATLKRIFVPGGPVFFGNRAFEWHIDLDRIVVQKKKMRNTFL